MKPKDNPLPALGKEFLAAALRIKRGADKKQELLRVLDKIRNARRELKGLKTGFSQGSGFEAPARTATPAASPQTSPASAGSPGYAASAFPKMIAG